jgi:hypothetical protein
MYNPYKLNDLKKYSQRVPEKNVSQHEKKHAHQVNSKKSMHNITFVNKANFVKVYNNFCI